MRFSAQALRNGGMENKQEPPSRLWPQGNRSRDPKRPHTPCALRVRLDRLPRASLAVPLATLGSAARSGLRNALRESLATQASSVLTALAHPLHFKSGLRLSNSHSACSFLSAPPPACLKDCISLHSVRVRLPRVGAGASYLQSETRPCTPVFPRMLQESVRA